MHFCFFPPLLSPFHKSLSSAHVSMFCFVTYQGHLYHHGFGTTCWGSVDSQGQQFFLLQDLSAANSSVGKVSHFQRHLISFLQMAFTLPKSSLLRQPKVKGLLHTSYCTAQVITEHSFESNRKSHFSSSMRGPFLPSLTFFHSGLLPQGQTGPLTIAPIGLCW